MSYITAADDTIVSEITNGEKRVSLTYAEIPGILKDVFVISEDRTFFQHKGIDLLAIGRAILINAEHEGIEQGGSTITQQVARNIYLNHEKSYNRKLSDFLYSYQLERNYNKEKILELYINAIYFGNGAYGIEAASLTYFNTSSQQLSEAELLFLAAIPNNPSLYNPIKNFASTKKRQERLIDQLVQAKTLPPQQAKQMKNEPITLTSGRLSIDLYPDYITYVEEELGQLLAEQNGLSDGLNSDNEAIQARAKEQVEQLKTELLQSGVIIHSALHPDIQERNQQALQQTLKNSDVEGAVAVIQHHTHELVSLTGAKDYQKHSFRRGYQSFCQPGSAIKPLLVYGPYIAI